jgi:putative membrane protein
MKAGLNAAAAAAMVVLFSGSALLAHSASTAKTATKNVKAITSSQMSDQAFAETADRANLTEVKLGKLAEEKGGTATVRDFGKRMVTDHTEANDKLETAASHANLTLPSQPSTAEDQTYMQLSKLSGKAFDEAYARDMLKGHEHDVAAFKKEVKDGKNQDIKNWTSQTLPVLEEHLKLARQMYDSVEPRSSKTTGTGSGSQR